MLETLSVSMQSTKIVLRLIKDERVEVREKASKVLGGLIHCSFLSKQVSDSLLEQFKQDTTKKIRKKPKENEDPTAYQSYQTKAVLRRHSGVLGLSAFVLSCPYDIPEHLPDILMLLADHLHDPQPIPATVKNVFQVRVPNRKLLYNEKLLLYLMENSI